MIRAAQSAGAREQKWYLLPGTNQNVAGTIGKEREKMEKILKILTLSFFYLHLLIRLRCPDINGDF